MFAHARVQCFASSFEKNIGSSECCAVSGAIQLHLALCVGEGYVLHVSATTWIIPAMSETTNESAAVGHACSPASLELSSYETRLNNLNTQRFENTWLPVYVTVILKTIVLYRLSKHFAFLLVSRTPAFLKHRLAFRSGCAFAKHAFSIS